MRAVLIAMAFSVASPCIAKADFAFATGDVHTALNAAAEGMNFQDRFGKQKCEVDEEDDEAWCAYVGPDMTITASGGRTESDKANLVIMKTPATRDDERILRAMVSWSVLVKAVAPDLTAQEKSELLHTLMEGVKERRVGTTMIKGVDYRLSTSEETGITFWAEALE